MFCKKDVLRNFAKFTGKHLCQSLFFNKVAGLRPATVLKKRIWHRCLPVNFAKFLRTPFSIEHLRWLLLYITNSLIWLAPFLKNQFRTFHHKCSNTLVISISHMKLFKRTKKLALNLNIEFGRAFSSTIFVSRRKLWNHLSSP